MVLALERLSGLSAIPYQVAHVLGVGGIRVEVVLKMLNGVHLLVGMLVVSDIGPLEAFFVDLIGGYFGHATLITLLFQTFVDFQGIIIMLLVKSP